MNRLHRLFALTLILASTGWGGAAVPLLKPQAPLEIRESRGGFGTLLVDDEKRRLLLAHTGNGTLDVLDLTTEKLVQQVKVGAVTSVILDAARDRYYVSMGSEKKFLVIDRSRLEVIGEIRLPGAMEAITLGPSGVNRVFASSAEGAEVWVLDVAAKNIASTLTLPAGPSALVVEDDTSRIYMSVTSDDSVQVISAADNNSTIGGSWPVAPAKKPQAMALDLRTGRRLFVAGINGKLVVLKAGDGQRTATIDIATGVTQIAFDAGNDRLYCPSSSGKLSVLDTSGNSVRSLGQVTTVRGAKSIAVDPRTHAVWLAYTDGGKSYAQKFVP